MPQEIRDKISSARKAHGPYKGHPCSAETKQKISIAQKGRKLTNEHRNKLSLAKKGKPRAALSAETKKKISDSHTKTPVYCPETNTVYPSIQECSKQTHIDATSICAVCKGRHKTAHGLHFVYYDDAINA